MGVAVVVVAILVVVLLVRHHKSVAVWRRWQPARRGGSCGQSRTHDEADSSNPQNNRNAATTRDDRQVTGIEPVSVYRRDMRQRTQNEHDDSQRLESYRCPEWPEWVSSHPNASLSTRTRYRAGGTQPGTRSNVSGAVRCAYPC